MLQRKRWIVNTTPVLQYKVRQVPMSSFLIQLPNAISMEQHAFKNVNNCLNTNIYSYLETSGGQSSNPFSNVVHFLNTRAD